MILSELIPFLTRLGIQPKKSLSQNFLVDPNIVRKIVDMAEVGPGDAVLEIGPGPGALTAALLEKGAYVYAIEMDRVFARELSRLQNSKLTIIEADFLQFPLPSLPQNLKIVANLPYHITTPILEKLFDYPFSSLTIMVQKEVAERMAAQAGSKTFGALSLFVQFYTHVHSHFLVAASCFYPPPKVDSTVIRLNPRPLADVDIPLFFSWIHKAFQKRRKQLTSSLPLPKEELKSILRTIGVREDARPEILSLEKWLALFKKIEPTTCYPS